jgi:hypothetical protein
MAASLLIFVTSRLFLRVGDERHAKAQRNGGASQQDGGRRPSHQAIDIAGRVVLAIPLLGVGVVAIHGFGAGYYSRFWI